MNMCLLEAAICEKCWSIHLQLEGGSKKFEYWWGGEGLKNFRTGGVTNLGWVLLLVGGGGKYLIKCHGSNSHLTIIYESLLNF